TSCAGGGVSLRDELELPLSRHAVNRVPEAAMINVARYVFFMERSRWPDRKASSLATARYRAVALMRTNEVTPVLSGSGAVAPADLLDNRGGRAAIHKLQHLHFTAIGLHDGRTDHLIEAV